jgi:hypothetical protein
VAQPPGSGYAPAAGAGYAQPGPAAYPGPAPAYGGGPAYGGAPGYTQPSLNKLCLWGMIVSIVGLLCGIGLIVGLILSIIGLTQVKRTGQRGRGMAIAGIIIPVIAIAIGVILVATGSIHYQTCTNGVCTNHNL